MSNIERVAMAIESDFQPSVATRSPLQPSLYQYHPLDGDLIRMIELLPGSLGDKIHVLIHHRTLLNIPTCSAISYMWGDPSRIHDIFCDGKVIKVTASVFLLLEKLRTSESQLLWLDGICINQDDIVERSKQVPLMRDIYQLSKTVLIWIGDEMKYTIEAFEVAKDLAQGYDHIKSTEDIQDDGFRYFKTPEDIPELSHLAKLTNEPCWKGVVDSLLSRKYFRRLWIVQEIVLAKNPIVVCGRHRILWDIFYKATVCIWYCQFLQKGSEWNVSTDIRLIGDMRTPGAFRLLPTLLGFFSAKQASEPRDRIYALLGMLEEGRDNKLLEVDYTKPVGRVFRDANEYIIIHHQLLNQWSRLTFEPNIMAEYDIPSWAEIFNTLGARFVPTRQPILTSLKLGDRKMTIEGDVLTIYAIIFDTVEGSLPNFSEDNFKKIILDVFMFCLAIEAKVGGTEVEKVTRASQRTLRYISPYEIDRFKNDEAFFGLVSNWMLADLGIDASVVQQNPRIKDLAENHPKLKDTYPEEIESGMNVQGVVDKDEALKWMLDQAKVDHGPVYENGVKFELFDEGLNMGRNVFVGRTGYCGVGPVGRSGGEGIKAAVQAGDVLALVYGVAVPMIMRLRDDGMYTVVGSCHVGNLKDVTSPVFAGNKLPEPVALKIR